MKLSYGATKAEIETIGANVVEERERERESNIPLSLEFEMVMRLIERKFITYSIKNLLHAVLENCYI